MKIGLIRHFPVQQVFPRGLVSQPEVLNWFRSYNRARIKFHPVDIQDNWESCYSSDMKRAKKTAAHIYKGPVNYSSLLNEPTPDPLFKANIKLPFIVWGIIYRMALLYNHKSQSQRKEIIEAKLARKLRAILQEEKDTLIVGHVFTIEILSRLLIEQGFTGKIIKRPKHGVLYTFTK